MKYSIIIWLAGYFKNHKSLTGFTSTLKAILVGYLNFTKPFLLIFLPFFMLLSCTKDKPVSLTSGEITLSSQTYGTSPYYILGYSFEKQDFFQSLGTSGEIDIYLNELLVPSGDLAGAEFSTSSVSVSAYGFYHNSVFTNLTAAEEYYKNYISAFAPKYVTLTDTIKKFDVYTFRTWKSNYVKFLVKDIHIINKGDHPDYIEVDIKYFIQRDGSVNLAN